MEAIRDCATVINEKRKENGITVRALAKNSGVSEDALYNILSGKRKMSASELLLLSHTLKLTFDDYQAKAV